MEIDKKNALNTEQSWLDIDFFYYNYLTKNYFMLGEKSIVYKYYLNEIEEAIRKNDNKDGKIKSLDSIEMIVAKHRELIKVYDEEKAHGFNTERTYDFIKLMFKAFNEKSYLYDQPLVLNEKDDEDLDGGKNNKYDFKNIVNVLLPFAEPLLHRSANEIRKTMNLKKSNLKQLVSEICTQLECNRELAFELYTKAGLLDVDQSGPLNDLVNHAILRSVDKSFKNFLYTDGYRITRSKQKKEMEIYVERLSDGYSQNDKKDGKTSKSVPGRKGAKPDKTLSLVSEICKEIGILSLDGSTHLYNDGFKKIIIELFDFINSEFENQTVDIDIILAIDRRTGASFHLLGNKYYNNIMPAYRKVTSACSFAIFGLKIDDANYGYKLYADKNYTDRADNRKIAVYGIEQESSKEPHAKVSNPDGAEILYKRALIEYRITVKAAYFYFRKKANKDLLVKIKKQMRMKRQTGVEKNEMTYLIKSILGIKVGLGDKSDTSDSEKFHQKYKNAKEKFDS